jgi:hypothetical protein
MLGCWGEANERNPGGDGVKDRVRKRKEACKREREREKRERGKVTRGWDNDGRERGQGSLCLDCGSCHRGRILARTNHDHGRTATLGGREGKAKGKESRGHNHRSTSPPRISLHRQPILLFTAVTCAHSLPQETAPFHPQ